MKYGNLNFQETSGSLQAFNGTGLPLETLINLLALELFFLILAHPVYKMWIIQEPNMVELWNKLHFEEKKNGQYIPCLKYSVTIFVE